MCIPIICEDGYYWSLEEEWEILRKTGLILENQEVKVGGQNLVFDTSFMAWKYGMKICQVEGKVEDTMIGQKTIMPDYPMGLDFITSIHTFFPYYKTDAGKIWLPGLGEYEQEWIYSNYDTLVPRIARPKIASYLEKQGNVEAYRRKCDIVGPLSYMMVRGIRIGIS